MPNVVNSRRPEFPGSIFVAVRTGGVGKTLLAQVLQFCLSETFGFDIPMVSLDAADEKSTSKLKKVLPQTQDIRFAPSMSDLMRDPSVSVGHFDQVAALMAKGGHLFDFGANVSPVLFSWVEHSGIGAFYGRLLPITLVVPVVAHAQSIGDAIATIEDAWKFGEYLPVKKIVVVYNGRDGKFGSGLDGFAKLKAMEAMGGRHAAVTSIELPRLLSEVWKPSQDRHLSLFDILNASPQSLSEQFDLTIMAAGRGRRDIKEWLAEAGAAFGAAGLIS